MDGFPGISYCPHGPFCDTQDICIDKVISNEISRSVEESTESMTRTGRITIGVLDDGQNYAESKDPIAHAVLQRFLDYQRGNVT
jgi:hypothetical protein